MAWLSAIKVAPEFAILSSGWSLREYGLWGLGTCCSINIPGLREQYPNPAAVVSLMESIDTAWMVSYSANDNDALWPYEAVSGYTESQFTGAGKVSFVYHDRGHIFPQPEISNFLLSQILTP